MRFKKLRKTLRKLEDVLKKKEGQMDRVIALTREAVRRCATGIKYVHAKKLGEAEKERAEAGKLLLELKKYGVGEGTVMGAQQEYAELVVLLELLKGRAAPTHEELGIPFVPYLLGLCDVVGELRREMLHTLKDGNAEKAGEILDMADAIYEEIAPLRFSNSLFWLQEEAGCRENTGGERTGGVPEGERVIT